MVIHFSVLIVIIIVSYIYNSEISYNKSVDENYFRPVTPWVIVFGYLAFLSGMRTSMNDTQVYRNSFIEKTGEYREVFQILLGDGKDKGFYALESLFRRLTSEYHIWFMFIAGVISICFIFVYSRNSYNFAVTCYFFWASILYYNYFSMMRQWLAAAIMFVGFQWIKKGKCFPYVLLCIFAAQFHNSAYFGILFYFLSQGRPWRRRQNFILCTAAVGLAFINPLLDSLETSLQGTTYDYVIETMNTGSGSSPIRIVLSLVPVLLAFLAREFIAHQNDRAIDVCVNMSILNLLLNIIATITSGLYVIRLSTYLSLYSGILYSYLLERCLKINNRQIVKIGFYTLYFFFFCYQMSHQGAWEYSSDILGTFL